jgi:hypothetical protein
MAKNRRKSLIILIRQKTSKGYLVSKKVVNNYTINKRYFYTNTDGNDVAN